MTRFLFSLLGVMATSACAGQPVAAPIALEGTESLSDKCSDQPPVLSDAQIQTLIQTIPLAEDREQHFWSPRDLKHRAYELCERDRADRLASIIARNNQLANASRATH